MSSVKLLLRNKNSKKHVSINYDIHISGNIRLRGSTNVKVESQYWDQGKQQIRNVTALSETKDKLNKDLRGFKNFVLNKLTNYETGNLSEQKKLLKEDIAIYLSRKEEKENQNLTFYPFIEKFIEQSGKRVNETTGKKLAPKTIMDYERTRDRIIEFEKLHDYPIEFDTINLDFYYGFKEYLENEDFAINTIGKFIKNVKVFMNAATELGYNTNLAYKNKRFVKLAVETDQIYLDINELQKIIKLDLSSKPGLNNARDLFIIGAFTGLRVSDFIKLTKDNIKTFKGKRFFVVEIKKTNETLPIPIHPEVEKIIQKNNGTPPKGMAPQTINKHLKTIGEKAKIKDLVSIKTLKGGKVTSQMMNKFDLIRNHTARRSFCTNAYRSGMSTLDIMTISGHKSEKTFLNYIKITAEDRAIKISENPFFNPKLKLA